MAVNLNVVSRESLFLGYKEILTSRLVLQQRNASKPIKASVKVASKQPSVLTLANLGIKVRDFAYESKLPPIQTIYCHPRQIQPAVVKPTLKRQWTESGEDDYFSQSSSYSETDGRRKFKLERNSTEPLIPPTTPDSNTDINDSKDDHEDDYFSQSSSQPETSRKKLERTSTEPVIPPTPDSTDIDSDDYEDNYFSQSSSQPETSRKLERVSTEPVLVLLLPIITPSPDSTKLIQIQRAATTN
jgi:hypothetical protein